MDEVFYCHIESPLGPLLVSGDAAGLSGLSFPNGHKSYGPAAGWRQDAAPFAEVRRQLEAWFGGEIRSFDLPLVIRGTAFQRRVWALLAQIPFGVTRSYGALAQELGNPGASRAVGLANGANPIPIILPCHRVIGSTGALTGFGGGLAAKRFLLGHEGHRTDGPEQLSLFNQGCAQPSA